MVSGRGRLTVCAALAALASACALLPLVASPTWLMAASLLVAVQSTVGTATRRVPLARPLTVGTQALVSLLLMTLFFVRGDALGGIVPGPGAFEGFGALLAQGGQDVSRYAIPAPVTPGIRLMLIGGVLVIALLVDAIAVTYRSAAPAGLPLLALYSVAAGLSDGGARWLWFLLAAAGYLLLLLAEGRDRLSGWGRLFTSGRGPGGREGAAGTAGAGAARAPVRAGRRIGAVTLGIALTVPAVLPTLDGGLLDTLGSPGSGTSSDGNTITAVNPLVALQDSLNQPDNRTVLTYRTSADSTQGMYLRIVALDEFDGSSWKPSRRRIAEVPDQLPPPPGLSPDVPTEKIRTSVSAADWYAQNWLPMPYPASRVRIDGRWRFEPVGRTLVGDRGQTTRGARYTVESLLVEPTREQLAGAPEPDAKLVKEYTRVPPSLPQVVHELALRVTRGADDDYERAVKLQDYFAVDGGFTYDTHVKAGTGTTAIARFLKEKEGFCVHFAFSMAAMARTLGIPARVAVGFTPGTQSPSGVMKVGLQDAHAWPELYFAGVGWTRFEPTPTRGSTPSYAMPEATGTGGDDDTALPPKHGAGSRPAPGASPSADCPVAVKRLDPTCGAKRVTQTADPVGRGTPLGAVVALTLAGTLLLCLPLLPWLWRVRTRRRRLRPGAGPAAVWQELLDTGWDHGVVPDPSATPRRVAGQLTAAGSFGEEPQAAAHRVALAVERELYAPGPQHSDGLAQDVLRVRTALRAGVSRGTRLRATLWPRSAVRMLWSVAARRQAAAHRWRARLSRPAATGRGADGAAR